MPFVELTDATWDRISAAVRWVEKTRQGAEGGPGPKVPSPSPIVTVKVTSDTATDGRWSGVFRQVIKTDVLGLSPEWEDVVPDEDEFDLPVPILAIPMPGQTLRKGEYLALIVGQTEADPDDFNSRTTIVVLAFAGSPDTSGGIVVCKTASPASGSGVGAQCYGGKMVTATASGLLESFATGENVWITVLGLAGPDVPEVGRFYGVVLRVGDLTISGDTRPRVFVQPAGSGSIAVVHVVQIDEDPWYCQLVNYDTGWVVSDDGTGNTVDFTDVIEKDGLSPRMTDVTNGVGDAATAVCILYRDAEGQLFIEYPRLESYDDVSTPATWDCSGASITVATYQTVRTTVDNYRAFPNLKLTQEVL